MEGKNEKYKRRSGRRDLHPFALSLALPRSPSSLLIALSPVGPRQVHPIGRESEFHTHTHTRTVVNGMCACVIGSAFDTQRERERAGRPLLLFLFLPPRSDGSVDELVLF